MKSTFFLLLTAVMSILTGASAQVSPEVPPRQSVNSEQEGLTAAPMVVTPDVIPSATVAVNKLGEEVVRGNYQIALTKMNPLWLERNASMKGGMEALQKELSAAPAKLAEAGLSFISFKAEGVPRVYEVGPGKKVMRINGQDRESLIFTKWLVLVPTVTKLRITPQGSTSPIFIESKSFQVAISEKGKNDWSFIDGSSVTAAEMRSLFINLPADMELPPVKKREIK